MIIKKYSRVPDTLIPIIVIILSMGTTAFFWEYLDGITTFNMQFLNSLISGLAAVGLHQTIKQFRKFLEAKRKDNIAKQNQKQMLARRKK